MEEQRMTELASMIHEFLEARAWQQKQLAHEWMTNAGSGSPDTYVTRLSKLLNDADEAFDFVLDRQHPERLEGLAKALSMEPSRLRALCEATQRRITLVLDPDLGEKTRAHLRRCAEASAGKFHCVEPQGEAPIDPDELRTTLRDLAREHRNAVVVLGAPSRDCLAFFQGAAVRTSFVESLRPGYRLSALPDLLPPVTRSLFDIDGMPMIPDESRGGDHEWSFPGVVRQYEQEHRVSGIWHSLSQEPDWVARIDEFGSRESGRLRFEEGPPLFRLDWLLLQAPSMVGAFESLAAGDVTAGLLWLHGNRILAFYPEAAPMQRREAFERAKATREAIARYHEVHEIQSFAKLEEAIWAIRRELNPRGEGEFEFDLSNELRAFEEETGITLSIDGAWFRRVMRPRRFTGDTNTAPAKETITARRCSKADARFRAILDDLLAREFSMSGVLAASVLFELEVLRSAPLVHIISAPQSIAVLANVGAGNLTRIDLALFPRERPGIVRVLASTTEYKEETTRLDANDIVAVLRCHQGFRILEGTTPRSIVNHRKAAEDARRDDD